MRARSKHYALVFSLRAPGWFRGFHGPYKFSTRSVWRFTLPESGDAVSTDANFLSREKRKMSLAFRITSICSCGISAQRLLLPRSCRRASRYTSRILAMMKRSLPSSFSWHCSRSRFLANHSADAFPSHHGVRLRPKTPHHGIPNAGRIKDLLYRGGQPKEQGLTQLKR